MAKEEKVVEKKVGLAFEMELEGQSKIVPFGRGSKTGCDECEGNCRRLLKYILSVIKSNSKILGSLKKQHAKARKVEAEVITIQNQEEDQGGISDADKLAVAVNVKEVTPSASQIQTSMFTSFHLLHLHQRGWRMR